MSYVTWSWGLASAALIVGLGSAAQAREATPDAANSSEANPAEAGADASASEDLGHGRQFGLRFGYVLGFRTMFRYDDSPYCEYPPDLTDEEENPNMCGFGAPGALEFGATFALLDALEPYAMFRLGLGEEEETQTEAMKMLGVGLRIYTTSEDAFKFFVEPGMALSFEGGQGDPAYASKNYGTDVVFHLGFGPHYDFARQFGLFATAEVNSGITRALSMSGGLQFGLQGRLP